MADLSNVPPEVLQIMTHDPPYSPGEQAILQAYTLRPDANPVVLLAFQNMGVMPGDSARSFHRDLRNKGASDINWDTYVPAQTPPPQTGPFGWTLDALAPLSISPGGPAPARSPESNVIPDSGGFGMPTGDFLNGVGDFFSPLAVSPGPDVGSAMESSNPADYLPAFPFGGGTSSRTPGRRGSSSDPYTPDVTPPSSLTAAFGAPPATGRQPDGIPAGSNTMTQGAGTPGTSSSTDWRSVASTMVPTSTLFSPDSAFADVADSQIHRVSANPEFIAKQLYDGAPLTAAGRTEWLSNVKMLADLGLLSNVPNADIFAGRPESDVTALEQIEEVNNAFQGQGSQIDPRALYQEAFSRLMNSDASQFMDPDAHGTAGDAENQVAVTNGMLSSVTPFVYSGSQKGYIDRLNRAGMQYLSEVAASRTSLSYPEWLKSQGAMDWL